MPSTGFWSARLDRLREQLAEGAEIGHAMASTPANGPSPTTLIQISAQISVSTPRIVSRKRRDRKAQQLRRHDVARGKKATGSANSAASVVPSSAIASVSTSAFR